MILDPALLELHVEIGVCKAALRPMFLDHDIALLGAELGVELATPAADRHRWS